MSQFYLGVTAGSLPPTVLQQFTADDATIAVPAAGNINNFSSDTTVNNANGIQTTNSGSTITTQLTNRSRVSATTSDGAGQTQTATIFTPPVSTGITFVVSVTGYDSANNEVAGGELVGVARRSAGGTTFVLGTNDTFDESDTGLAATDWDIVTDGTLIQIQFSGVAGRSIAWSAVFVYDQSP